MSAIENFVSPSVTVVRTNVLGQTVLFAVDQPRDLIQSHHLLGRFYEADELMIMSKAFPPGGAFLDIGANVGNHTVFFGKILKASHILPVEVNPRVISLLRTNIILNGLEDNSDLSHLGIGLYDEASENASVSYRERNIGGGKVVPEGGSGLTLMKGDDIFTSKFDLVKIDVEGAEIKVLNGMKNYLNEFKPNIFVEVDNGNSDEFLDWIGAHGYAICDRHQSYKTYVNYLITPQ